MLLGASGCRQKPKQASGMASVVLLMVCLASVSSYKTNILYSFARTRSCNHTVDLDICLSPDGIVIHDIVSTKVFGKSPAWVWQQQLTDLYSAVVRREPRLSRIFTLQYSAVTPVTSA